MPAPVSSHDDRLSRWGYVAAIIVSALGHALLIFVIFVVLPGLFSAKPPPPSYTVRIVDSLPAGNLGTHLPALNQEHASVSKSAAPTAAREEAPTSITSPPTPSPDQDEEAVALNTGHSPSATPTPMPTPRPTPLRPRPSPRIVPSPRPHHHEQPLSRMTPVPRTRQHKPRATPTAIARATAKPTPDINQEIRKLHEKLMAEHLKQLKDEAARDHDTGGPVLASRETEGKGYGVGPGAGSSGLLESADFLLYCQTIKKKIQDAWNFAGKNPKLTATVTVGINPDGSLNAVTVSETSRDPAFDDSVVRAIRLAAPFPPPPEKYRAQFAEGVPVIFNLGALESSDESAAN